VRNDAAFGLARSWSDSVFLSADALLDDGDRLLGEFFQSSNLAPGASGVRSLSPRLPDYADLQLDSYFLIVRSNLEDSDVSDNVLAVPLSIARPDLAPTRILAPAAVLGGQSFNVTLEVGNQSGGAAGGFFSRLALSADPVFDASDVLLGGFTQSDLLAAGDTASRSFFVSGFVTAGRAPGTWYLLGVADEFAAVAETDETDNVLAQPIIITSVDLAPTSLTAPPRISAGTPFTVEWTTSNIGLTPSGVDSMDGLYWSTDAVFDGGDIQLAMTQTPATLPGVCVMASWMSPPSRAPPRWFPASVTRPTRPAPTTCWFAPTCSAP
jgi:hypothetical protein